jgi:hypothetical protein
MVVSFHMGKILLIPALNQSLLKNQEPVTTTSKIAIQTSPTTINVELLISITKTDTLQITTKNILKK